MVRLVSTKLPGIPLLLTSLLVSSSICLSLALSDTKRLTKHLLENYQRLGLAGRPVHNQSDIVEVTCSYSLLKIQQFDQENGLFTILGVLTLKWHDVLLMWNPADFGWVDRVITPERAVWTPDIVPLNAVEYDIHGSRVVVTQDGMISWSRQQLLKVYCDPDLSAIDKEEPSCQLDLASWTLGEDALMLRPSQDRADSGRYMPHRAWELYKTKAAEGSITSPCCEGQHAKVTYTVTLRAIPPDDADAEPENAGNATRWHMWHALVALLLWLGQEAAL